MLLKPCLFCPKTKFCRLKKYTLKKARGLGLTTGTIKCDALFDGLEPGTRVCATFEICKHGWGKYGSDSYMTEIISGTVTTRSLAKYKVVVWLDGEPLNEDGTGQTVRLYPSRLTLLNEPLVEICQWCNKPKGKERITIKDCGPCHFCGE